MSEITKPHKPNWIVRAFNAIWQNPIVIKEMRSRMRRRRTYVVLSGYLLLLAAVIGMIYMSFVASNQYYPDPDMRRDLGKAIFYTIVVLQLGAINFISPSFTATSITNEREHQTLDLVRTTLVSPKSIIFGKFLSGFLFSMLMLLAGIPLQTLAFLFGGIEIAELLISSLMLIVTAATFSMIGVYVSSLVKKNRTASSITFLITNGLMIGIPVILGFTALLMGSLFSDVLYGSLLYSQTDPSISQQIAVIVFGFIAASSNPAIAGVISQTLLISEDAVFYYMVELTNGDKIPFISPWISFTFLYLLITWLFYWRATKRIGRKDKK